LPSNWRQFKRLVCLDPIKKPLGNRAISVWFRFVANARAIELAKQSKKLSSNGTRQYERSKYASRVVFYFGTA
jgi:hypothetical protein